MVAALFGAAACTAPPIEPFGSFSVTRSGGVAGVDESLRVEPDGVAVLTSPELVAGRLSAERMAAARRVLESTEFAREARDAERRDDRRCSDTFATTVRMGALMMSVEEPCGEARGRPTPAFDELLGVVADARNGRFDAPLSSTDVPAVTVRVEQPATGSSPSWVVTVDERGQATLTRPGEDARDTELSTGERQALAVVAAGLIDVAATPCSLPSSPTVEVTAADGRRTSGRVCGYGGRSTDAYAVARTLGRTFDLI